MTTGSWTVGSSSVDSPLYATKTWNGDNGRYEVWNGGIRARWNAYTISNTRWTQNNPGGGDGWAGITRFYTFSSGRGWVGFTANDELRVLNKLAEQIKGHSFDAAINMAEAGKTYGLVLGNVRSLGNSLVNLKRGNIAGAFRELRVPSRQQRRLRARDVSGRWLEMQYGWRPLVDQAYEAAKALESQTKPRTLRFKASSTKTKGVDFNDWQSPFAGYRLQGTVRHSYQVICDLYENLSVARSLGLTNPAAVAWEVVPYSFCVDWFLPIGSYLSAWGVIPALKGRFLTVESTTVTGYKFTKLSQFPLWRPADGYSLKERFFGYRRTPSGSLTVPRPTMKSIPQALSPAHLYNAVALVHQRLGK
jgi:hypothetical protein